MYYVKKELIGGSLRPIIELDLFPGCLALIDTGAVIPVWTGEEEKLATLKGVSFTGKRETFGSFGSVNEGNVYEMTWMFGNLHYIGMPIIAYRMEKLGCQIILPATMFGGMRYTIDNIRRELIIESGDNQPVRNLKVLDSDGKTHILAQDSTQKSVTYKERK
ncbi:MAG: hypothetical protein NC302_08250 [Bacteroidales bacterium]|nr:hypothetical protein [Bacteroidales bacterium]MCM1415118.1 hypothetical protein [bacterium]MCM1423802.1 hypothetical protein [bacterium]